MRQIDADHVSVSTLELFTGIILGACGMLTIVYVIMRLIGVGS